MGTSFTWNTSGPYVFCKTLLFNVTFEQHKSEMNHLKFQVTFPHSVLNFQQNFPLVCETLYTGRVKLFVEASELVTDALADSSCPTHNGVLGEHPSGGQKDGNRRVLKQIRGRTNPRCRLLWVKSLLASSERVTDSCCWNSWRYATLSIQSDMCRH